jgi:hypothetical protein
MPSADSGAAGKVKLSVIAVIPKMALVHPEDILDD